MLPRLETALQFPLGMCYLDHCFGDVGSDRLTMDFFSQGRLLSDSCRSHFCLLSVPMVARATFKILITFNPACLSLPIPSLSVRVRVRTPRLPQKPRQPAPTTRPPPDILTCYYGPRMAYISPREYYDAPSFLLSQSTPHPPLLIDWSIQRAIDIAVESFPEFRDVERDRICLEVHVMHSHPRAVEVGRTAWPFLVATLARFDLVEVRVSPPSIFASASSSSAVEPTPYVWDTDWPGYSDTKGSQMNLAAYRTQMSCSSSQPHPNATRIVVDLVPSKSS